MKHRMRLLAPAILVAVLAAPATALANPPESLGWERQLGSAEPMQGAIHEMAEMNETFNLMYLQLQQKLEPSSGAHVVPAVQDRLREYRERARQALGVIREQQLAGG